MNRSIHVALCVYASIVFGEGNDREFVFPEEEKSLLRGGFSLERKVVRFPSIEEEETSRPWDLPGGWRKGEEWKGENGQTGGPVSRIVDELISRTTSDEDGGTKAALRCLSRQTRFKLAVWIYTLCSQSFLRFSKPIFLLRERKEFLILSPISFDPIIARLFPNVFRVLNNSSSSPIVKLECNSAVNQN